MMTLKMIQNRRPEVAKLAMEKYPLNKAERRGCQTEKAKRDYLRWEYAKRLINETPQSEKQEYGK